MATDRVGIEIDLMGYDEAMSQMENLERSMKGLSGHRNRIKIQAEVEKLKMNRDALKAQKVRIEADTKNVDREITRLRNRIKQISKGAKLFGGKAGDKYTKVAEASIERLKNRIKELQNLKVDMNWRMGNIQSEINQTTSAIQRMEAALRRVKTLSAGQIFKKVSSSVGHMGAAMKSAGNALNRLTAPMRMLGSGMLLGAGFSAINKVTEGLSSGFERYDIMKKFPRMMSSLGYEAEDAQKSIDKLDKSVRGLPTGLDHMVDMTQRFALSLGDLDKGTDVAIATNNAFLASMSTETQQYQGMMQLQDLLNGKKLNAREWMSLSSSMGAAVNEIAKVMGAKTQDEIRDFRQQLNAGKIDTEDFLDALIEVGTGEGKIAKMAEESKDTWQAFSMNIKNAFSRMSAGVIQSVDEITQVAFGKDLNQLLSENVLTGIDNMTKSIKDWIKANPDKIMDFFNDLKGVDWKGLGTGFLDGFKTLASVIQTVAQELKGKDLEKVGKAIFWMQAVASGLTIGGGLLKGGRHLIGGFVALITGIARGIGAIAPILGGAAVGKMLKNTKLFGKLAGFFKGIGKVGKAMKGVEKAGAVGKAAGAAGKAGAAGGILKGFLPAIEIVAGIGAVATEILGIAWVDTKILKANIDNIIAITDGMQTVFDNVKGLTSSGIDMGAVGDAVADMFEIYSIIGGTQQAGGKSMMGAKGMTKGVGGTMTNNGLGDMNPAKLKKFADSMTSMNTAFTSIKGVITSMVSMQADMAKLSAYSGSGGSGQTGFDNIAFQIRSMMNSLKGVVSAVDGMGDVTALADKTTSLTTAIDNIKSVVSKLNSLGGKGGGLSGGASAPAFGAIQQIKTMVSQLGNALNTETLGALQMQVSQFKSAVDQIFQTLNGDLENVEVEVHINGKVTGHDKLIADINAAKSKIMSAVRSIPNSITRHVYIHVTPHVNVGSFHVPTASELGGGQYRGGLITGKNGRALYRAKGGSIFGNIFKPKGTDTVPAMLTPGEYVHRKEAVDTFGVRFMQKVNQLDVAGAFRELSARMGSSVMSRRGTTIYNNNITNNSPTINQTVNTRNPDFVFKRPSRYITAL